MRKTVVCVFAHPDDEAFGPAGTIYKLAQKYDTYILCATKGDVGQDDLKDSGVLLTERRAQELRESAKILGVKQVFFLGFKDGTLSNNLYHSLSKKIHLYLEKLRPHIVLTYEPRGVSGHIDHVVVSFATQFVLRNNNDLSSELWMFCSKKGKEALRRKYFIYFPEGYENKEIDKTIDVSSVWDIKRKACLCHKSQRQDAKKVFKEAKLFPKEEHFLIKKRPF